MKKVVIAILASFMIFSLVGCSATTARGDISDIGLYEIESENGLVYDKDTRIVYYMIQNGIGDSLTGFMSPYYSENGRLCKYENDKIVEIINDNEEESN